MLQIPDPLPEEAHALGMQSGRTIISFSLLPFLWFFSFCIHPSDPPFTVYFQCSVDISFLFHFLCCLFFISFNIFLHYSLFLCFYGVYECYKYSSA
jgi:hypothetical protein